MHMKQSDLSFLYLLEAILDGGSVSAAADRLGLSQSATSHALGRLRERFNDPLFVKTKNGMRPTPEAERLGLAARKALEIVRTEMLEAGVFDPATTQRTFVIGMSDMASAILLPRIVKSLSSHSSVATLRVVNLNESDVQKHLEDGDVDVAVGSYNFRASSLMQQALFKTSEHVCILREGSPHARGSLTPRSFSEIPQVICLQSADANDFVDRKLASMGLSRNVALVVPYLLPLPKVIASSDYMALVPAALAVNFSSSLPLQQLKSPLTPPRQTVRQYWHERYSKDAGGLWFRAMLYRELRA